MLQNRESFRRIGIAGYMGAGKSTCARHLAGSRARIIDADREAKILMTGDASIRRQLATSFGVPVTGSASLDFDALGKAAFSSVQSMRMLNGIVHPALVKRLRDRIDEQSGPCILDAALIPLWGIEAWFDRCLWVTAEPHIRSHRVQQKTGISQDTIALRMSIQEALVNVPSGPRWMQIGNNGSFLDLEEQLNGLGAE
jgi:dephospho-CoA kinase